MKYIAVLMTCHNRKVKTIACLEALHNCHLPNENTFDVFLVDDGSIDGTSIEVLSRFPDVKVIQGNGLLFWNRGMCLAWSEAAKGNYDYYLWLNDDTILKPDALQILMSCLDKVGESSIVCGVCETKIDGEVTYSGLNKKTEEKLIPNGVPQLCDYFNGNVVLVPASVFNVVGNLDPIFHHGLGDFDYGMRASKQGIKSYVTTESIAYCEKNDLTKWFNPKYSLIERLSVFTTPLGGVPFQFFEYAKRHYGYKKAITNFLTIHIRLIFPRFWNKYIKAEK
ncbi:glycosyltransferase family 2 protein [Parabacteroides sp. FAFU027]|uniref:glycosyltransferase family 2 protein n=1 Tax=Parabacteroides sp. FAFU027 TaxID=2922715 RepID=UPI001FB00AFD|nr:glycosyltransferase family 2 protein [Parabacteroides sp. FAFU027]